MGKYMDRKAVGKCVKCGFRELEFSKTRCLVCKEKHRITENKRRRNLALSGICHCGKLVELGTNRCLECGVKNNEAKRKWRKSNPQYYILASRQQFINALNQYGGQSCKCCNESNIFFLTIDHINNNGAQHRKETGGVSGKNLAWWLKKNGYPSGFQVLCFNCNCGRARNDGVCPHHGEVKWL